MCSLVGRACPGHIFFLWKRLFRSWETSRFLCYCDHSRDQAMPVEWWAQQGAKGQSGCVRACPEWKITGETSSGLVWGSRGPSGRASGHFKGGSFQAIRLMGIHHPNRNDDFFPFAFMERQCGRVEGARGLGWGDLAFNLSSTCHLIALRLDGSHFQFPRLQTDKNVPPSFARVLGKSNETGF